MRTRTGVRAGGYGVDNWSFPLHFTGDGSVFEAKANHHRGDASPPIDATSMGTATDAQWSAIALAAWTGNDEQLTAALAAPWPTWTSEQLTPALLAGVRAGLRRALPQVL